MINKPFTIGLTGGIGSGKTAASDRFQNHGIAVVDADIAARVVVEPGRPALSAIADHFGEDILLADGGLNRAALRNVIFNDPEQKSWLEALLHPLIAKEITAGLQQASSPYALLVSPLLIESSQKDRCHRILVVDVPEALQIQRTAARDNNDPEQVKRIIASQASRQQRLELADDVVENDGSLQQLHQKIDDLHRRYLQLAAQHAR